MTGETSSITTEKENYVKKLKRNFDSWREIVLILNSVFLWQKRSHPWIIFGITTLFFLKLVYYNPSFLTTISLIGFVITVFDFVGPSISNAIWKQENWTALKERELEEVCKALAGTFVSIKYSLLSFREMRSSRPNMFYPMVAGALCLLAWVGNTVNNLLITYILVLQVAMLPGLLRYGILQKAYQKAVLHTANILHSLSSNQKKVQ